LPQLIKSKDQFLTEEIVASLIGKFIHVPTNIHEINTPTGATTKMNVWFAGVVAGYEKAVIGFDYETGSFKDEPENFYNVHLTDGMGYILTTLNDLEILELNEDEFNQLVEEQKEREEEEKNKAQSEALNLENENGEDHAY